MSKKRNALISLIILVNETMPYQSPDIHSYIRFYVLFVHSFISIISNREKSIQEIIKIKQVNGDAIHVLCKIFNLISDCMTHALNEANNKIKIEC